MLFHKLFIIIILILLCRLKKVKNINQVWAFRGILIAFMIGTVGEAYMVNITNIPSLFNWVILCVLSSSKFIV